jgi:PAS domain S-box-containing protein
VNRILDAAPLGTLVIRDGRIRYASAAAVRLLSYPEAELLGRPYTDFVAADRRAASLERHGRRLRGEPAPDEFETEVLRKDGTRIPVEVFVTRDDAELVVQLRDLSEPRVDRERLIGLARLGAEIQRERSAPAVFDLLRWGLDRIGVQPTLVSLDGDGLKVEWSMGDRRVLGAAEAGLGRPLSGMRARWSEAARTAWREGAAFVEDLPAEVEEFFGPELGPAARQTAEQLGFRQGIDIRIDQGGQPRFLLNVLSTWLRPRDLAAFRLFGAQVSAALDAGVAIADLSQRNAELAALNALAELAGRAHDLDTFLGAASGEVMRSLDCQRLALWLLTPGSAEAALAFEAGGGGSLRRLTLEGSPVSEVAASGAPAIRQPEDDPPALREELQALGLATRLLVPLKVRSAVLGVLAVGYAQPRPDQDCPLELLQAMGAHFAAAVENHRLLSDLRGRVSELILLNDLALATATLDPVLLFENALRRMMATLGADAGAAYLLEGGELHQSAVIGFGEEATSWSRKVRMDMAPLGQAVARLSPVQVPDTSAGGERSRWFREKEGIECALAVPLLVKDRALGAFLLARRRPQPFAPEEIQLLSAVGAQLAVAVENARLFEDTRRRAADLEAVNALALEVFGSPLGDPRPLLDATCRRLTQALAAQATVVFLVDEETQTLKGVAAHGQPLPPPGLDVKLRASGLAAEALRSQEPVRCVDTGADPYSPVGSPGHPRMSMLMLPLTSRRSTRGLVVVADAPGRIFTDGEVALAYALAGEAAMGLENAELYAQERQRAQELGMVLEVGRSLVSTLDLDAVLDAGVRNLARIVEATDAYLLLPDASGTRLEFRAVAGGHPELLGRSQPLDQPGVAPWVFLHQQPLLVDDGDNDPRVDREVQRVSRARAYLAVPLTVRGRAIGTAVIVEQRSARHFTQAETERATAIANQLAVAVENARLYADLRRSYADLARAQAQLVHRERLAALGELSAVVAHEVRNPLGVIFNSLGSLKRLLRPEGDAKLLLDIVGEESDRLNRIVGDLLDFARPQAPALRLERVDRVVDEAVASALAQRGGALKVAMTAEPGLPPIPLDARLFRQAMVNLALNAAQAMPHGGTLEVRLAASPAGGVEIAVKDAGPGIPPEVRHRIFEPFFTTKATGTGIGLAVVKRIVDEHHGEITVESAPGRGTTFLIKLPATTPDAGPAGGGSDG